MEILLFPRSGHPLVPHCTDLGGSTVMDFQIPTGTPNQPIENQLNAYSMKQ